MLASDSPFRPWQQKLFQDTWTLSSVSRSLRVSTMYKMWWNHSEKPCWNSLAFHSVAGYSKWQSLRNCNIPAPKSGDCEFHTCGEETRWSKTFADSAVDEKISESFIRCYWVNESMDDFTCTMHPPWTIKNMKNKLDPPGNHNFAIHLWRLMWANHWSKVFER